MHQGACGKPSQVPVCPWGGRDPCSCSVRNGEQGPEVGGDLQGGQQGGQGGVLGPGGVRLSAAAAMVATGSMGSGRGGYSYPYS